MMTYTIDPSPHAPASTGAGAFSRRPRGAAGTNRLYTGDRPMNSTEQTVSVRDLTSPSEFAAAERMKREGGR